MLITKDEIKNQEKQNMTKKEKILFLKKRQTYFSLADIN